VCGDDILLETDWNPKALSDRPKIVWKVNIGIGHTNIAVKVAFLYTMGYEEETDLLDHLWPIP
jgi:hypothetical protein